MRKIVGKWYPRETEDVGEDRVVEISFNGDFMYIKIENEGTLQVFDIDMIKTFAWSGKED